MMQVSDETKPLTCTMQVLEVRSHAVRRKCFSRMNCSIAQALEVVGEWWTLLILREALLFGSTKFGEFRRRLEIADNILSERLRKLIKVGIFKRARSGNGRRSEYHLTEMGQALLPVVIALMQWGDRWIAQNRGVPVRVLEKESGEEVPEIILRSWRGRSLTQADIILAAGPGANASTRARLTVRAPAN